MLMQWGLAGLLEADGDRGVKEHRVLLGHGHVVREAGGELAWQVHLRDELHAFAIAVVTGLRFRTQKPPPLPAALRAHHVPVEGQLAGRQQLGVRREREVEQPVEVGEAD